MKLDNLIDKKLFKNIDLGIIMSVFCLVSVGIVSIASATQVAHGGSFRNVKVQIIAFALGIVAAAIVTLIDYNNFGDIDRVIYVINIALLVLVLLVGSNRKGAQAWIDFGPLSFQPSEIVKIGFILTFAKHLEKRKDNLDRFQNILPGLLHAGLIIGLVLLQPDFGTALVFIFITAFMYFAAGINYRYILGAFGALIVSVPILWFGFFKEYQKKRILVFLNPEMDPLHGGYHVIQSKIAIGSGQFAGKGIFKGTQNNLGFIPERHTDFIFSVIGEEAGLIGCVVVILLFLWLILRCIKIAQVAKDDYGMLICVGVMAMFMFHIIENIGMTIGIMPVTGIPLPFISYGGSSLLTNLIAVSLVINVGMRRQVIRF